MTGPLAGLAQGKGQLVEGWFREREGSLQAPQVEALQAPQAGAGAVLQTPQWTDRHSWH